MWTWSHCYYAFVGSLSWYRRRHTGFYGPAVARRIFGLISRLFFGARSPVCERGNPPHSEGARSLGGYGVWCHDRGCCVTRPRSGFFSESGVVARGWVQGIG